MREFEVDEFVKSESSIEISVYDSLISDMDIVISIVNFIHEVEYLREFKFRKGSREFLCFSFSRNGIHRV
jgi:hypothetical protein